MGTAAHLIHGSSDGRFTITYAVKDITRGEEIESVGFQSASYDELAKKYDLAKLSYGYNTVDGEEFTSSRTPRWGSGSTGRSIRRRPDAAPFFFTAKTNRLEERS